MMIEPIHNIEQIEQMELAAKHLDANDLKSAYAILMPLLNEGKNIPGFMKIYALLRYKHGCLHREAGNLGAAIAYFRYAYEADPTLDIARDNLKAGLAEWERVNKEMLKKAHGWWMPVTDWSFETGLPICAKHKGRHVFEIHHIEAMIQACTKRRRAIDIGGHIGSWSWVLADFFDFVEAFEPNPIMQTCFKRNVEHHNVTLHPYALGKDEGRFGFVAQSSNTGNSHIAVNGEEITDEVEVRRLDSYMFSDVDFIKMDAEGFEAFIISGGIDTLLSNRPIIFMEVNGCAEHYGLSEQSAIHAISALGAKVVGRAADGNYLLKWDN